MYKFYLYKKYIKWKNWFYYIEMWVVILQMNK